MTTDKHVYTYKTMKDSRKSICKTNEEIGEEENEEEEGDVEDGGLCALIISIAAPILGKIVQTALKELQKYIKGTTSLKGVRVKMLSCSARIVERENSYGIN